jgi:Fanconi anemia group J protein
VLAVSIPFPLIKDLKVMLKREYNDARVKVNPQGLTGQQWYVLQAFRALNQSLGRCLRHKDDYGAVLLLDSRFTEASSVGKLSRWLRGTFPEHSVDAKNFVQEIEALKSWFSHKS